MSLYVKFFLFALVLAMMGPFLLKGDDGRPLVSFNEVFSDGDEFSQGFEKMFDLVKQFTQFGRSAVDSGADADLGVASQPQTVEGKTKVHRWKDAEGVWQFSDANTSGGDSEVVYIDPNTNILEYNDLDALKKLQAQGKVEAPQARQAKKAAAPSGLSPVSNAMDTMQQAQGLQNQLDDRYQRQQDALNNIR